VATLVDQQPLSRRDQLRLIQLAKYDEVFTGRTFDIVRTVNLPKGQCFITQFGNKGRHGYIIRDRKTGEEMVVGLILLKLIHDRYLGVSLPKRLRLKDDT
jgi:hypothetical protein